MILFAPTNDRTLETSLMMKSFQILIILHIFSKVQVRLMVDQCNARGSVGEWSKIGKTWQMDLCCPNLQCDREGHLNLFIYGPPIYSAPSSQRGNKLCSGQLKYYQYYQVLSGHLKYYHGGMGSCACPPVLSVLPPPKYVSVTVFNVHCFDPIVCLPT